MSQRLKLVVGVVVVALCLGFLYFWQGRQAAKPVEPEAPASAQPSGIPDPDPYKNLNMPSESK